MADTRYDRIFRAFLTLALLLVLSATPAEAQQQREARWGESPAIQQPQQRSSSSDLPSWAEPGISTARRAPGAEITPENDPGGPGPIDQVPVDGGLALLAVAGAGYAVRKLRKTPDDER